jgi:hypothetical protein
MPDGMESHLQIHTPAIPFPRPATRFGIVLLFSFAAIRKTALEIQVSDLLSMEMWVCGKHVAYRPDAPGCAVIVSPTSRGHLTTGRRQENHVPGILGAKQIGENYE